MQFLAIRATYTYTDEFMGVAKQINIKTYTLSVGLLLVINMVLIEILSV